MCGCAAPRNCSREPCVESLLEPSEALPISITHALSSVPMLLGVSPALGRVCRLRSRLLWPKATYIKFRQLEEYNKNKTNAKRNPELSSGRTAFFTRPVQFALARRCEQNAKRRRHGGASFACQQQRSTAAVATALTAAREAQLGTRDPWRMAAETSCGARCAAAEQCVCCRLSPTLIDCMRSLLLGVAAI